MTRTSLTALLAVCFLSAVAAAGDVVGYVKLKGDVPEPELQREKGDAGVKDASVCAAQDFYENDLIVNKENKGIANAFIYMRKAPAGAEFDPPAKEKLIFDQKNCRFLPHAQIVRTGQEVELISSDPIAHNFHSYPIRNDAQNVLVAPNTEAGDGTKIEFDGPEILPIKIGCDIHPWMTAWWMVVDHPFAAVTDENGQFKMSGLPDGTHEFRLWHERAGYLEKKLEVTVKDGKADTIELEYDLSTFED